MEIYLDNSATTKCSPAAIKAMKQALEEDFGNPSSMHLKGVEAERSLKKAKETLAKTLKVQPKELILTSGGTESNNTAILGAALANRRAGNRVLTTAVEHSSVAQPMKYLEELGFEVEVLPVNHEGLVSPEVLKEAVTKDTILVSMMYVNNEIGTVQPIAEAAALAKEKNPDVIFHTDAVQAYAKYRIFPKRLGVDLLSVSSHKFHGPKGAGFLYKREKVKIKPLLLGGGQQDGMRSGTDNVPGAVGMAAAAQECYGDLENQVLRMRTCRQRLLDGLACMEHVKINGSTEEQFAAPHIVNASFPGVRSEVLLHALEERGIFVSAGSACSSNKKAGSATLQALGLSKEERESAIRFSFCTDTTTEEIGQTIAVLQEIVPFLRKYSRK